MKQVGKRRLLGDLLLEAGLISDEQLSVALKTQGETSEKLGDTLISLGFVSNEDVIRLLEQQFGIPYIRPDASTVDIAAVKLVSELLARRYEIMPIRIEGDSLILSMSDPLNIYAVDDVSIATGFNVIPAVALGEEIRKAISIYYGSQKVMEAAEEYRKSCGLLDNCEPDDSELEQAIDSAPIVKMLNSIIEQAVRIKASDIHIEPQEKQFRVRFRRDGQMEEIMRQDMRIFPAISTRIKIISDMNIAERRRPQDGRMSTVVDGRPYDLRVSSLPTVFGEKIVFRLIDATDLLQSKEKLLTLKEDLDKFDLLLRNTTGVILVTGPTGSGKSTTLYTTINELNHAGVNIITVEDPVEAVVAGVNQVHVNVRAGMSFSSALRSILRQDPDIIVIGEIRDAETAEIAVRAAVTGHLVISTLHTNDSASTIARLLDMRIEPFLISTSLAGVVSQRLMRRICKSCIKEYRATENELQILGLPLDDKIKLKKGKGCNMCGNTGYSGRVGVYEILTVTPAVKKLINEGSPAEEIKQAAIAEGMQTLHENAKRMVFDGVTTVSELVRVAFSS